jgi:hypothetical protein
MATIVMATIVPRISKSKMPTTLRWPVKYMDLEAGLAPFVVDVVGLEAHFAGTNDDYVIAMAGNPIISTPADALNLLTVRCDPEEDPNPWYRSDRPFPDDAIRVEAYIWAVLRSAALARVVSRESLRHALAGELSRLAAGGLFRRRWLLKIRARPEPARLECFSVVWTGIRRENTEQRTVRLPAEDVEAPERGRMV